MLDETVRIKMPMPKCCQECWLKTTYNYYENSSSYIEGEDPHYVYECIVTGESVYTDITPEEGMKRHKDCPIVVEEKAGEKVVP